MKILGKGEMVAAPTIVGRAVMSPVSQQIALQPDWVSRDVHLCFLLRVAQKILGSGFELESVGYSTTPLRIPLLRVRHGNEVLAITIERDVHAPTSIFLRLASLVPAADRGAWERTRQLQAQLKDKIDAASSELGIDKLQWEFRNKSDELARNQSSAGQG